MFKNGDKVIINSKTSTNNGKVVTILYYCNGKCKDILMVEDKNGKKFTIKESSLKKATYYDVIRNMSNNELDKELIIAKQSFLKIKKIMNNYEKTFDWGCNDNVHSIIAHAVYGIITGKEYFLEEYKNFLNENLK